MPGKAFYTDGFPMGTCGLYTMHTLNVREHNLGLGIKEQPLINLYV